MSSANVIPSAPPRDVETKLYPSLPATQAQNVRLTKIREIEKEIVDEVEHYRLVLKTSKSDSLFRGLSWHRDKGSVCWSCCNINHDWCWGFGWLSFLVIVGIAVLSGAVYTGLTAINKKLERKVNKHSPIHALAVSKHDTINNSCLLSS